AASARAALEAAGYERVEVRVGDGTPGVPDRAPFDAIAVAAAVPGLPPTLYAQVAQRGRIALPVRPRRVQEPSRVVRSPVAAAVGSFCVAVTNDYPLNRHWTFRGQRGHFAYQGLRFLVVSVLALGANLVCLRLLVALGRGKIVAQAIAIVLVTPLNFVGNK